MSHLVFGLEHSIGNLSIWKEKQTWVKINDINGLSTRRRISHNTSLLGAAPNIKTTQKPRKLRKLSLKRKNIYFAGWNHRRWPRIHNRLSRWWLTWERFLVSFTWSVGSSATLVQIRCLVRERICGRRLRWRHCEDWHVRRCLSRVRLRRNWIIAISHILLKIFKAARLTFDWVHWGRRKNKPRQNIRKKWAKRFTYTTSASTRSISLWCGIMDNGI